MLNWLLRWRRQIYCWLSCEFENGYCVYRNERGECPLWIRKQRMNPYDRAEKLWKNTEFFTITNVAEAIADAVEEEQERWEYAIRHEKGERHVTPQAALDAVAIRARRGER